MFSFLQSIAFVGLSVSMVSHTHTSNLTIQKNNDESQDAEFKLLQVRGLTLVKNAAGQK